MRIKAMTHNLIISVFFCIYTLTFLISAQSFKEDSTAVRKILDFNGYTTISVDSVSEVKNNRIVILNIVNKRNFNDLTPEIGKLTALEELYIGWNFLTQLPPEIGNLSNLRILDARINKIKTLPKEIKNKMHLIHYADNYDQQDIEGFAGWTQEGVSYVF